MPRVLPSVLGWRHTPLLFTRVTVKVLPGDSCQPAGVFAVSKPKVCAAMGSWVVGRL